MARRIHESIEVQAPLQNVVSYWSNFESFPRIMRNAKGYARRDKREPPEGQQPSRYQRGGRRQDHRDEPEPRHRLEQPRRRVRYSAGAGRFEEVVVGRTRIAVTTNYAGPSGDKAGEVAANVLSNPEREMREDLEDFAKMVERSGPGNGTSSG